MRKGSVSERRTKGQRERESDTGNENVDFVEKSGGNEDEGLSETIEQVQKIVTTESAEMEYQKKALVSIMYKPPPGFLKPVEKSKPGAVLGIDVIPDLPENKGVRDFLAKAPTKGLWMPLGKEVKVMQCWRCKQFGHRAGDKECPLYFSGNMTNEAERRMREDPMNTFVRSDGHGNEEQQKKKRFAKMRAYVNHLVKEYDEAKKNKKTKKRKADKLSEHKKRSERDDNDYKRKKS